MKLTITLTAALVAALVAALALPLAAHARSPRRGIAYDLAAAGDYAAVSPGVSWWYNWTTLPNAAVPISALLQYGMDYAPMLWNDSFPDAAVTQVLLAHPYVHDLMVLNEPNVTGQAYMTPQAAAKLWPRYEAIAAATGTKIVGPQITWGTMPGYQDPVAWLDAFHAAYESSNNGRQPEIDYLGFHWYDYGLAAQVDRLDKYGKPIWVTEFANWHSQNDGAQIDTLARQEAQMKSVVSTLETRADVFRYAWFTGRISPDPHFDSLLGATGQLSSLGRYYLSLPVGQ